MERSRSAWREALLACGVLASLLYVAMNVLVPMQWNGYSLASQVISELSAIGAPTRSLWVPLGILYGVLATLFGLGVWKSAGGNRALRGAGGLLIAHGALGLAPWPPMHLREVLAAGGGSLTDTLHIAWSMIAVLLMMLSIGFGAAALGPRFRRYSLATMTVLIVFGALTGLDSPKLEANLPTPWMGVWERINIGVFMLWVVVLAIVLLLRRQARHSGPLVHRAESLRRSAPSTSRPSSDRSWERNPAEPGSRARLRSS